MASKNNNMSNPGSLFVPAGILTGMGFGFLYHNLTAGLFIGLGVGFLLYALVSLYYKSKESKK